MTGMALVQRSFYGGVLILVILAVRTVLLGRLPKRTFPVLWTVVLLRLLLPISFASVFSIYSLLKPEQISGTPVYIPHGMTNVTVTPESPFMWVTAPENLSLAENLSAASKGSPLSVPFVIWSMGVVLCAVFFGVAYFRCLWSFRTAVPVEDSRIYRRPGMRRPGHFIAVRQSDKISAPLTYGILRPVILLPERLVWESRQEMEYVLQHEYVHICHCDSAVKLAMVAALCIHWFNPLVWLMSWLLNRDIELACDEGVLRRFGEESRAGYAMTLIGMEEKKRGLLPLYNGFSKNAIEERIRLIMKYKKITYMMGVSALMLILVIVLVFATSAKPVEATEIPENVTGNGSEPDMTGELMDPPKIGSASGMSAPEENNQANAESSAEDEEGGEPAETEYVLSYMQEGILQEKPADLYVGEGYYILLPKDGWKSSAPDTWVWEANEQIRIWVNDCSGSTWEQVAAGLEVDGYHSTEEDGILEKESDGSLFYAERKSSGSALMCVNYTYPADPEYIEGFGSSMRIIAANFAIVPNESEAELSEDGKQIEQTARAFWEAYLAGNAEAVGTYLAEDYDTRDIEVFPDGSDGHVAAEAQVQAVKGVDTGDKALGDTLDIWVEFRPAADADYLEYLAMKVIKEQDGWKVLSYGLEM